MVGPAHFVGPDMRQFGFNRVWGPETAFVEQE
jgi:hypothetical protein